MAILKTRFNKSRNTLQSLLRAVLEEKSKASGLVTLMLEIKDQISEIVSKKKYYDNVEEFQWLHGQLVCLKGRITKEMSGRLTQRTVLKIPVSLSVRKVR